MGSGAFRLAAITITLLLGACGQPPSPPADPDDLVRWWPGDAPGPGGPFGHKELAVLDLPKAAAGGLDLEPTPRGHAKRLVLNLEASGQLYFRGMTFPSVDGPTPERLRDDLRDCARGAGPCFVLLRIDRLRPWGDVLRLVGWTTDLPNAPVEAVHFAVDVGATIDARIEGRVGTGTPRGDAAEPGIVLDVESASEGIAPRLRIGERVWPFAAGDPYAPGSSLDGANAAWLEVRDALRTGRFGSDPLRVEVDARVPWAHVAQLLALAHLTHHGSLELSTGARTLRMDVTAPPAVPGHRGRGLRRAPGSPEPLDTGERDPRDAPPLLLISIGVLLAALVVLLPLARDRRPRRPPRG